MALVSGAVFSPAASALDVPPKIHHAKTALAHIVDSKNAKHPVHRGAQVATHAAGSHATGTHVAAKSSVAGKATAHAAVHGRVQRATVASRRRHVPYERFTASSFVTSQGEGDITAGEDPTIRAAVIDALGNMNGTAVVINPANGRILAMVNQKLALSPGAEPCSTIKLSVGLAALSEGLVTRDTPVNLGGFRMNMTEALAHSNNLYFEEMGRELGFERVRHYATQFGLGELAGYNIEGEQLGTYPDHEIPASEGGVGRMCSFGQGVSLTPLQLGAFVAAIANGGTLYYLQHPTTSEEAASFEPRIKRTLDIARFIPDLQDGMAGAVEYGTARRLRVNFHELPVFGKTGTCSNNGTRFGWFASYSDSPQGSLVTVFFLEGGRPVFGPRAAELTGLFYRSLWDRNYFSDKGLVQAVAQNSAPAQKQSGAALSSDLASQVPSVDMSIDSGLPH
jgi:membrane carboxypeptidase/penicillin-binding protein